MKDEEGWTDPWLPFALAFVGGYGDATSFVLAKTFTGHVTGNLVFVAISTAGRDWRAAFGHLLAISAFLAGIFLSGLIVRPIKAWTSWQLLPAVMGMEIILMGAASIALKSHATSAIAVFVICVSLALGMQNGAFRRSGGISIHTTYLTGMITSLISAEADKFSFQPVSPSPAVPNPKISLLAGIWLAFVVGACIGAAVVFRFREAAILGAALVLCAMIVRNTVAVSR